MDDPTQTKGSESMTKRLISADSHVQVSHDQVKSHLPAHLHAAYDEVAREYEARMAHGTGAANRAGAKGTRATPKKGAIAASNSAFTRRGYWDPVERLKDMDTDGVDVEIIYSEVSAFRYLSDVREGVAETVRAFNDTLHEFASAEPSRLVVSYQIPIHDIDVAVAEVERVVDLGGKSLQLPVFPAELGEADYYDPRYERLLGAIQASGLPICCHIGLKTTLDDLARRDPTPNKGIMVPLTPLMTAEAMGMWIMGGVLERFPDLKLVFVEPGLGWVPWWLETVDDMVARQGYKFPAITELPSSYFHRNISLTFIDEHYGLVRARDLLGTRNIMWSTDFPHPVTSWPRSKEIVEKVLGTLPDADRDLIAAGNAARVWSL
jgi:predicted TIM-barrel fold metal-dependent hydrolase